MADFPSFHRALSPLTLMADRDCLERLRHNAALDDAVPPDVLRTRIFHQYLRFIGQYVDLTIEQFHDFISGPSL